MPTLPDNQVGQLNVAMSRADSSGRYIVDGLSKPTNGNPPHFPSSSVQNKSLEPYPIFRDPMELNKVAGHNPGLQSNTGHPVLSMSFKRKAITERPLDNRGPQKMSGPNKRVAQVGPYATSSTVSHASAPKKIPSKANTSTRKVVQIEPITNEARSNIMKKNVQPLVSPKSQTESRESVRAKLRESLASALALVSQDQESCTDGKIKIENRDKPLDCPSTNGVAPLESPMELKAHVSSIPSTTSECSVEDKTALSFHSREIFGEASQAESFLGVDFQYNSVEPVHDSLFSSGLYFKDDFLQGNGLSWESDLNLHDPKVKDTDNGVKPETMNEVLHSGVKAKTVQSPESVAHAIELELYKLFSGVNKKYKEKGRSLLFNLKDPNNPELRERVMSGELPPNRLCSMTAEDLASKELSQWRIAKAEELDNMKVLPETDINMRRLVKKTHKGEYQVDFEPDGGAMEETPVEISAASSKRSKNDKFDGKSSRIAEQTKTDQCEITIPSDGADMQGLMGDDLNDLPPVMSLDEFFESLDQDPPFENLPVDSMTTKGESDKENVVLGSKSLSPVKSPKYPLLKVSPGKVEVKQDSPKADGEKKLTETVKQYDTTSVFQLEKLDCLWEGQLQLNLSSMANFMAFYKSGEKASSREWGTFFDIKGRVRHDAFNKFLQALPMSRSRAIMVCHFVLNEGVTDDERANLKELVDSYIADERLGFAEPGTGVEIYLCAPRSKTVDMIVNHLPKSYTDKINEIDDGLIGIVVWRKVQITSSAMSPNSSQPQPVIKKQIRGHFVDNNDMKQSNVVFAPKRASPPPVVSNAQPSDNNDDDDDDDDAPPGFGPPGPRDDDDLPEFQFSGGSLSSLPSLSNPSQISGREMGQAPPLQVEQMRELIQKYGQTGNIAGNVIPTEPWNEDDDDIPEWQPQPVHNPILSTHIVNHQPHMEPPMANHQMLGQLQWAPVVQPGQPLQPLQAPMGVQYQRAWGLYGQSIGGLQGGQFPLPSGPGSGHSRNRGSNDDQYRNG